MSQPSARAAGTFKVGGDVTVNRLGFGAMRLTGRGVWDEPEDRAECVRVLKRLAEVGVNFVDTADSYGPFVSEALIAEALHPFQGMLIATKGGFTRQGPDKWAPVGRPEYLRQCVLLSLRHLRIDRIDLWQLHRIDPKVPRDEQFGVIAEMMKEGLVRHAGLSQVTVDEIEAAQKVFPVATVQNRYNLADREDEALVDYCESHDIGFIPWFPLAAGELTKPGSTVDRIAKAHGATASQVALAWMLKRSPVMLPIPGTSKVSHLEQNVAGAALELSDDQLRELNEASPPPRARAA
jgi:aryl-alcohol dehydrogenase-like predicted oxidoreductase